MHKPKNWEDPRKKSVDSTGLKKIKQEFSAGDLPEDMWNYDPRRFVQDGINVNFYYIH